MRDWMFSSASSNLPNSPLICFALRLWYPFSSILCPFPLTIFRSYLRLRDSRLLFVLSWIESLCKLGGVTDKEKV
jgi:hypothetical protein